MPAKINPETGRKRIFKVLANPTTITDWMCRYLDNLHGSRTVAQIAMAYVEWKHPGTNFQYISKEKRGRLRKAKDHIKVWLRNQILAGKVLKEAGTGFNPEVRFGRDESWDG